jgi:Fic family protein
MLFSCNYEIKNRLYKKNKSLAIMQAKRMLPEYIFDTAQLENNPLTFPEVKTLIDGITVGGHKIHDVEQVLNIQNAWSLLFELLQRNEFNPNREIFISINSAIARDEALSVGSFRTGQVSIAGTKSYSAPNFKDLNSIFEEEIGNILSVNDPIKKAISLFLWGCLNQFFWDGNKRTSRIIANGILLNEGIGIFNIQTKNIAQFNALMIDFYDSKIADNIFEFLYENCIKEIL